MYRKVASYNMSRLEPHSSFYRLLMKGIFDDYVLCLFGKKLIFELLKRVRTRDSSSIDQDFLNLKGCQKIKKKTIFYFIHPILNPNSIKFSIVQAVFSAWDASSAPKKCQVWQNTFTYCMRSLN